MSGHRVRRLATVLTTSALVALASAGVAGAEPAGNAEVSRTVIQGAGSAQVEATAADGGAIDITATATGGDPDLVGSLLGGLVPALGRSGPVVASGAGYVDITEDLDPGTYRATVSIDDATGVERAEGDTSSGAQANAVVAPEGAVASEQGDPSLGRDSADLGASADVVLEFEFEVATPGSYTLGVSLVATAQADGEGSSAVTTVSSNAVDAEITALG